MNCTAEKEGGGSNTIGGREELTISSRIARFPDVPRMWNTCGIGGGNDDIVAKFYQRFRYVARAAD